jgi:hypothetical protein
MKPHTLMRSNKANHEGSFGITGTILNAIMLEWVSGDPLENEGSSDETTRSIP